MRPGFCGSPRAPSHIPASGAWDRGRESLSRNPPHRGRPDRGSDRRRLVAAAEAGARSRLAQPPDRPGRPARLLRALSLDLGRASGGCLEHRLVHGPAVRRPDRPRLADSKDARPPRLVAGDCRSGDSPLEFRQLRHTARRTRLRRRHDPASGGDRQRPVDLRLHARTGPAARRLRWLASGAAKPEESDLRRDRHRPRLERVRRHACPHLRQPRLPWSAASTRRSPCLPSALSSRNRGAIC